MLEQRVLLNPCEWRTFESLVEQHPNAVRFTYSEGMLEILSPSPEHEELSRAVETIVYVTAEELEIDVRPLGSTTQRSAELQKGFEPDSSYYVGNVDRDPGCDPPDLVVEVEISRSAIDKLPIFASLGIDEVWRCTTAGVQILRLQGDAYHEATRSGLFPLSAKGLTDRLSTRKRSRTQWVRELRSWPRSLW
ncbi:MAG: Uma2 family endonuclease [Candidatus Eremiobacterota bacterium]